MPSAPPRRRTRVDWPDILGACCQAGVEVLVVEQDETTRDPLESLALSYRNLTEFLLALPDLDAAGSPIPRI